MNVLVQSVSGFWFIDSLIGGIPWNWAIEFFGENEKVLNLLFHHVIVYNSRFSRVYVIIYKDFGGLNPYLITRLSRIMNGDVDNVLVSRCFRYMDLVELLSDLVEKDRVENSVLIIYNPFNNVKGDPRDYVEVNRIISFLHRLKSNGWRIILFNKVSANGTYSPEGGNFHHHIVNVILRIEPKDDKWCYVEIVKHPFKRIGFRRSFPYKKLNLGTGDIVWVEQRLLTEWL